MPLCRTHLPRKRSIQTAGSISSWWTTLPSRCPSSLEVCQPRFTILLHLHCLKLEEANSLTTLYILLEYLWSWLVVGYQASSAGNEITADGFTLQAPEKPKRTRPSCKVAYNIRLSLILKLAWCTSGKPYRPGYEGFVDLSKEIMKGRSSKQQRETVSGVLGSLLPPQASVRFRKWFPVSKVCFSLY